ncbi:MAG: hypothetical protein ABSD58_04465 [Verrucomicrobiia bacterium]
MTKAKRSIKASREAKLKPQRKPAIAVAPNPDCPYRGNTLYGTLFIEGNRAYVSKDELIERVADLTGKSEKVVGFAFQVLKSPSHRSNKNRSTVIEEDGRIKLIAIRK